MLDEILLDGKPCTAKKESRGLVGGGGGGAATPPICKPNVRMHHVHMDSGCCWQDDVRSELAWFDKAGTPLFADIMRL